MRGQGFGIVHLGQLNRVEIDFLKGGDVVEDGREAGIRTQLFDKRFPNELPQDMLRA